MTLGNSIDFGDLSYEPFMGCGLSNSTRGIFANGGDPSVTNHISFVTIATTGNAQDFGDTLTAGQSTDGGSSPTRGVITGFNTSINTMEYIEILTTGNSVDFGDLTGNCTNGFGYSNGHGGL